MLPEFWNLATASARLAAHLPARSLDLSHPNFTSYNMLPIVGLITVTAPTGQHLAHQLDAAVANLQATPLHTTRSGFIPHT